MDLWDELCENFRQNSGAWLGIAIALALLLGLAGCAALPPCELAKVRAVRSESGALWFLLDGANANAVGARMEAIAAGACAPGKHWAEVVGAL